MRIQIKFSGFAVELAPDELRGASDADIRVAVCQAIGVQAGLHHIEDASNLIRRLIDERDGVTLAKRLAREATP